MSLDDGLPRTDNEIPAERLDRLIVNARACEHAAKCEFHDAVRAKLWKWARHLQSRMRGDADDLFQETLLRAMSTGSFEPRGRPWPWLYTIMRSAVRLAAVQPNSARLLIAGGASIPATADPPDSNAVRKEFLDALWEALNGIDAERQQALAQRLGGRSTVEIAAAMRIPERTVRNYVQQARAQVVSSVARCYPSLCEPLRVYFEVALSRKKR